MKRLLISLLCTLTVLAAAADYKVFSVSGSVCIRHGSSTTTATQGMTLAPSDEVDIAPGAKIEIHNTSTDEIFSSLRSGRTSVMSLMIDARKQASKTAGAINDRMRFSNTGSDPGSRLYSEGLVMRSMAAYDPLAQGIIVDPAALALHIHAAITGPAAPADSTAIPIPLSRSRSGIGGASFTAANPLAFPVYLNLIKFSATALDSISISDLGQPMGAYVLLPSQSITRDQTSGLDPAQSHLIILTYCRFDIDQVIDAVNALLADPASPPAVPDPDLPVFITRL